MLNILGIMVEKPNITEEDSEVFKKWNEAKAEKNFEKADEYRAILTEKGLL